uniref:RBD domain-containing protein n=1 Tax=Heterorhabditis bacteriophora TaxID=37862 RepID=A0A1I7XTA7_HETBA
MLILIKVSDLNWALKKRLNIPDQPMMAHSMMMAAPVGASASTGNKSEEYIKLMGFPEDSSESTSDIPQKMTFSVKLTKFDDTKKIALIKEIRSAVPGLNLVQAKKGMFTIFSSLSLFLASTRRSLQVTNWNAPMSLSIVLPSQDNYDCTVDFLNRISMKYSSVAKYLRAHVVFPVEWSSNCSLPTDPRRLPLTNCKRRKRSPEEIATYPANLARNVARMMPMYRTVKSHDGRVELDEIKATCAQHENLCRQFAECSMELQQNDAQLEILGETATFLKNRHQQIRRNISEKPQSENELEALEAEIARVDRQVCVWMKELEEVNDNRVEIEIRFIKLGAALKKSVTCVQLASIDFELIQMKHDEQWRRFLADHGTNDQVVKTVAKVPS